MYVCIIHSFIIQLYLESSKLYICLRACMYVCTCIYVKVTVDFVVFICGY